MFDALYVGLLEALFSIHENVNGTVIFKHCSVESPEGLAVVCVTRPVAGGGHSEILCV